VIVNGRRPHPGATAGQLTASAPVTIPFEVANHLVILKASVNGSRPLLFVLS
jgi:hypothetical protein